MGYADRRTQLSVIDELKQAPHLFSYEQCVSILERAYNTNINTGSYYSAIITTNSRHSFFLYAYDINQVALNDNKAKIYAERMSFTSFHGPLPSVYSERIGVSEWFKNHALSDFMNIFINRLSTISYHVSVRRFPSLQKVEAIDTNIGRCLNALAGSKYKQQLIQYAQMMWNNTHSALGLRLMISQYFDVDVQVLQFDGSFSRFENETRLGIQSSVLGRNAALGDRYFDYGNAIRILIGPLNNEQMRNFETKGRWYKELIDLIDCYLDDNIDYIIEFIPQSVIPPTLGGCSLNGSAWLEGRRYESRLCIRDVIE